MLFAYIQHNTPKWRPAEDSRTRLQILEQRLGAVLIRYDMEYITKSSERNIKSYKIEFESDRCSIPLSETHFAEKWRIDLTTIVLSNYFALLRNEKICFLREQYEANDNTWKTYSVQLRLED